MPTPDSAGYIGRFAPSPTGELHHGSLLTAVASYVDARRHAGQWLVRMEDLDPPREQPGAATSILNALEAHHLFWDGPVLFQSRRDSAYRDALDHLTQLHLLYPCSCSRQRLKGSSAYDSYCLSHPPTSDPTALRITIPRDGSALIAFDDIFQQTQIQDLQKVSGDFIVRRKDGLFAYQLAVVVDDIFQKVTHIIRGSDLLSSTGQQCYLFQRMGAQAPTMGHLPILVNSEGQKLSKQTFATPINSSQAPENLFRCLQLLGQNPPSLLTQTDCSDILSWAVKHWRRTAVPSTLSIEVGNFAAS